MKGDIVNNTNISEKLGSHWDCENNDLDLEVNDLARLEQLLSGEQCGFCGQTLTEQIEIC
jgi:hypothetical protein